MLRTSVPTDAGQTEAGQAESGLPREAYALLAQANLQRIRGHWEEAAQNCMAALRLAPDSSSAQSLLGDIYENQGRLDDAVQWYRMALDANPDSLADRLKLDRLVRSDSLLPASFFGPAAAVKIGGVRESQRGSEEWGRLRRLFGDPEIALRVCAVLAVLSVVLLVGLAFATTWHGAARFGLNSETEVKSAPVVVPPTAGALPADADTETVHDTNEQTLLTAMQASTDLSTQGISVYDLQIDPRTQQMTVTFGITATDMLTRADVARKALRTLQAATGQSVTLLTARCLLVSTGIASTPPAALAFVGDVSRSSLPSGNSSTTDLSDAQVQSLFSNVWWSPTANLRP